jgi:hypothetical protein
MGALERAERHIPSQLPCAGDLAGLGVGGRRGQRAEHGGGHEERENGVKGESLTELTHDVRQDMSVELAALSHACAIGRPSETVATPARNGAVAPRAQTGCATGILGALTEPPNTRISLDGGRLGSDLTLFSAVTYAGSSCRPPVPQVLALRCGCHTAGIPRTRE